MHQHESHGHHHHHHEHDHDSGMTDREKLKTLISNWISHNVGHAGSYRTWAERAGEAGHQKAAELMNEAARVTIEANKLFEEALKSLD